MEGGGPHKYNSTRVDIWQRQHERLRRQAREAREQTCADFGDPACVAKLQGNSPPDVDELPHRERHPELLELRRHFVLQDHMFEPNSSWSFPRISSWCRSGPRAVRSTMIPIRAETRLGSQHAADTGVTRRPLVRHTPSRGPISHTSCTGTHVSWRYYIASGAQPDCANGAMTCLGVARARRPRASGIRCPTSGTVHDDHQLGDIQRVDFLRGPDGGTSEGVMGGPLGSVSEHPAEPDQRRVRPTSRA